jgi:hypothetical protein
MQTKVQAPVEQSKHKQIQTAQNPAQLRAEPQVAFEDVRPETAQLNTMQSTMRASPQIQKIQNFQTLMATNALTQRRVVPGAESLQRIEQEQPLQAIAEEPVQCKQAETLSTEATKPNNTGLPNQLKAGIENLSGISMDHVKVHYNSDKPAQLQAHAYAQGSEIHVAPGQEKHLPHEAWHVVQQAQGRVRPTVQMKGNVPVNDDVGLETEADVMGAKALQMSESPSERDSLQKVPLLDTGVVSGVGQLVSFLNVKRIANGGNLFMGKSTAGAPSLAYGGGTNWYGPKATAAEYGQAPGAIWRVSATRALNLIDMGTADSVKWAMEETIRRRGVAGLTPNLLTVLGNFDFAYAIPNAVAVVANNYLQYANDSFAGLLPAWPGDQYGVNQAQMDGAVALAQAPQEVPLWAGSVIQTFASHTSANAVRLDSPAFLANPDNYQILRKDATNLDAGFANELLNNLNDPTLFHGLHVPLGMKFGGWTGTKFEILIKDSPNNLALHGQVAANGPDADMAVTDKTIAVDNSLLSWAWYLLGGNR